MAKICPLFSGSSGNCIYISNGSDAILIDAGVSAKRIFTALCDRDIDPISISGIFVTHSHIDHIAGLSVFLKKYKIPVYASEDTLIELADSEKIPQNSIMKVVDKGADIGSMFVERFDTPHDSKGSSGYSVKLKNGEKISVCTDLGYVTDTVRDAILGSKAVVIESNHDITMLQRGPYPIELKRRISGKLGHLSNTACADELCGFIKSGTTRFVLAHLSRENNKPEIARSAAQCALLEGGFKENYDYLLSVAEPAGNPVMTV